MGPTIDTPVRLDDLIDAIKKAHTDVLEQLSDAVLVADLLGELSDHLIGHFFDQARRSGAWGPTIWETSRTAKTPTCPPKPADRGRRGLTSARAWASASRPRRSGSYRKQNLRPSIRIKDLGDSPPGHGRLSSPPRTSPTTPATPRSRPIICWWHS